MLSFLSADNDLPKYIVKLIVNQNPIESIRSDLSLFLDANNTPFVDWLEVYLQEKKQHPVRKPEVIAANEIEEDILDFEEQNIDDVAYQSEDNNDQEQAHLNSSSDDSVSNKRKHDQLDGEQSDDAGHKVLLNNTKEPVKVSQKHSVISLKENKHLNDIGLK